LNFVKECVAATAWGMHLWLNLLITAGMMKRPRIAEFEGEKGLVEGLTIEKNGKALKIFPGKVSDNQIAAMQVRCDHNKIPSNFIVLFGCRMKY